MIWTPIITLGVAAMFFYLGKLHERFEWNKLIKEGKIPAPKKEDNE